MWLEVQTELKTTMTEKSQLWSIWRDLKQLDAAIAETHLYVWMIKERDRLLI
jgi:hypothetical protein